MEMPGYVAIRQEDDSRREWFDMTTFSGLADECRRKAQSDDKSMSIWSTHNPVVRIARVTIQECISGPCHNNLAFNVLLEKERNRDRV